MTLTERLMLRPAEAAELIGVSRSRCYQLINDGTLPSVRVGGTVRIPVEALKSWIASRVVVAEATATAAAHGLHFR